MIKTLLAAAGAFLAMTSMSQAQWNYEKLGGAFDGSAIHVLITTNIGYGFGIRCTDSLEVFFSTPDTSFDDKTMDLANDMEPKLLLRVDDSDPIVATGALMNNKGTATLVATVEPDLVSQIEHAKRRLSVAMKFLGDVYHEQKFGVSGSTANAKKLEAACPAATADGN